MLRRQWTILPEAQTLFFVLSPQKNLAWCIHYSHFCMDEQTTCLP